MSAPIRIDDSTTERIAKLLPAELTAAFLSCKAGLLAAIGDDLGLRHSALFWSAIAILVLAPFYFRYVTKIKSGLQIVFLCLSFVVFAISIAETEITNELSRLTSGKILIDQFMKVIAIVLPILWAFVITPIIVGALFPKSEQQ